MGNEDGARAQGQSRIRRAETYLAQSAALRARLDLDDAALVPRALGKGEHNDNYWFEDPRDGRRFVLRINVVPQPFHTDQVAYEHGVLKALEASGVTPRALFKDSSRTIIDKDVLVTSFCEGRELDFDRLGDSDVDRAVRLMADVHAVEPPEHSGIHRPKDPLRTLFDECVGRFREYRSSSARDERIALWVDRYLRTAEELLDTPAPPTSQARIVNTETLPSHFLLPEDEAKRGWFIDWERAVEGEVAQDVAYFVSPTTTFWDSEYRFPREEVDGLVERYWEAVDGRFERKGFDARLKAWRVMTALRSTTWFCRALAQRTADPHAWMTEKARRKMPAYLSEEFLAELEEIAR